MKKILLTNFHPHQDGGGGHARYIRTILESELRREFEFGVAAPEGSGVPVGTQYHWYILAHQNVTKLNANDYSTSMTGIKFKLAHKRADNEKWSASERAQRKRLIDLLRKVALSLEQQSAEEESKKKTEETTPSRRQATPSLSKAKKPEKSAPVRKTRAA